jgi:flagellar assembly factor FliW
MQRTVPGELFGSPEGDVPANSTSPAETDIPVIEVPDGLPGYPHARAFVLERLDDLGALCTLRALGDQGPAFFVIPPAVWFPDYEPVLDELTCASLELTQATDALVLLVVTMGERPIDATANLMAPLVVNARTRRGAQVVLSGTAYSVHQPLTQA